MRISKLALAAMSTAAVLVVAAAIPADAQRIREAQRQRQKAQPQPQTQIAQLTREESAAIAPVLEAVRAQNWPAATAALPAARAGAVSPYAKYVVGQLQYQIGQGTSDNAAQQAAITAMIDSGGAPPDQLRPLLGNQIQNLIGARNLPAAEAALVRYLQIDPDNLARLRQLADVRVNLNKRAEASAAYQRLIALGEASGQKAEDQVYRQVYAIALEARDPSGTSAAGLAWLRAYPTPDNWRTILVSYRQQNRNDPALFLDALRFMRTARLFRQAAEYTTLGHALTGRAPQFGEARAVIEEGQASGVLSANDPEGAALLRSASEVRIREDRASLPGLRTRALAAANGRDARLIADAYYGYGQYAEAAELYRAALQKGGEDASLINIRLGAALALAGRRAEAEAAFRAVTTGPRAELAQYWLLWLASRPA